MTPPRSSSPPPLSPPPTVEVEIVRDRSAEGGTAFLNVRRLELVASHPDGTRSEAFRYDVVDRRALDATVMVAHHADEQSGRVHVYLRSAVRPPLALRTEEPYLTATLWEVPAGLIEPGESPRAAAARELEEELGFTVPDDALEPLGEWSVPAPALIGEVHFYFHVRVKPASRREPAGDGSPLEHGAAIQSVPLDEALEACRRGLVRDAKTELALRRLDEALRRTPS